jgi:hypothetical protein
MSVTTKPCKCGLFDFFAKDLKKPIKFDKETNEYYFSYSKDGRITIRHCFFCGGKAPESLRSSLFVIVPQEEKDRLHQLTKNITTLKEAIKILGKPSFESLQMETDIKPRQKEKPEKTKSYKSFVYSNLSKTADVVITDFRTRGLDISFYAKSKKKSKEKA